MQLYIFALSDNEVNKYIQLMIDALADITNKHINLWVRAWPNSDWRVKLPHLKLHKYTCNKVLHITKE